MKTKRRANLSVHATLTWSWLAVLFVTTRIQRSASHRHRQRLLSDQSTNLTQLNRKPLRVLFASLMWLDGRSWWPYVPVFAGLLAPAERRLGPVRFVGVGLGAHAIATFASQKLVARSIRRAGTTSQARARDVGVSYFVFGIGGWLSGKISGPWRRWARLAAADRSPSLCCRSRVLLPSATASRSASASFHPGPDPFGWPTRLADNARDASRHRPRVNAVTCPCVIPQVASVTT